MGNYLIFVPLPGEYIASAVRRGNETLGVKGLNKRDYRIKKKPRPQGKLGIESVIEYPDFLINHQASSSALYENTLYPLAAVLGRTFASCVYTPHVQWKICLQCVIDDLENHGTAFIHRSHLIYSVSLCQKHAIQLHSTCPTCLTSVTTHQISQFTKCSESYSKEPATPSSAAHQYALFVHSLLNYRGHPFTTWGIEIKIVKKMQEKGLLEGAMVDTYPLIKKAKEILGADFKFEFFHTLSMDICSAMAFLAYTSADSYLDDVSHLPKQDYL